ncbi:DUF3489 domain-containing protein [Rhodobacter sp. Har01]|uniref:DUF3489 domain-containing protein n=1 Tax=Rhodobacter sp. Har01 TaxID=2883999 RepID=UPI001D09490E|nr:DUF3489 domain-containing protein [Rhodobacter sp. Har01]MCB6177534.1 DUF3489 domain-containing protein [Rhodobacter sp. Har01]
MTDLINMTKAQVNALLASPLTASQLKKTSHADLVAMFDAMPATDALDADLRDAHADDTPPTDDKTLLKTLRDLTIPEGHLLSAFAHCENNVTNGAPKSAKVAADLATWVWLDARKVGDMTTAQKKGVLSSLVKKGLLVITPDAEGDLLGWTLLGFDVVQALLEEPLPAMPTAKKQKAAPAPSPAPKKARVLDDRIITQPAQDQKHIKAVTQGSKRHLLIEALAKGATIDDLMTATGWNKDTVTSALRWDLSQAGLGCERKGGKYFLLLPKGFTRPAIVEKGQAKGAVLLAACKG